MTSNSRNDSILPPPPAPIYKMIPTKHTHTKKKKKKKDGLKYIFIIHLFKVD